ncbi:GNAT family N-acetyltransferase [Arenimonas sp. MALMAid1274]|uniref:GNAT family N-acetyltransferase n=1 Tax=Arenimonas sp. MALMAid1274 TaxID=3411630 RepID=UPI003B9E19EA
MNIEGKRVQLRAIEPGDLPQLQKWSNDPSLQRLLGGWHFPTSGRDQQAWLASLSCNSADQRFAVDAIGGGLIGSANLVSIDWKNRTAFHGMYIGDPAVRGQGLGMDTIMAMMRYAFDELGLARLDTDIIEYNEASLGIYTGKCGWQVEGVKKDAYFRGGRHWSKFVLGITASQYRELLATSAYWD